MKNEIVSMNIPEMSISAVIEKLSKLYINLINKGMPLKSLLTPFFWGAAGVGKSQGVYSIAKEIEKGTGKKTIVTDIRLLLMSPTDLLGVPMADAERKFTDWLRPRLFDFDSSDDVINILFLDELSAAPPQMQAVAYGICLDRKVGTFDLPPNCIVIAAGNRTTDKSVSYKMSKALCNRMMHFNIVSEYERWRAWAVENGISDKIIAYLAFDHSRLCVEPGSSDLAFCTPRMWANVSTLLEAYDGELDDDVREMIAASVGNDTLIEFENFCKGYINLPPVADILKGRCTTMPKGHDVMFATVSSLVALLRSKGEEVTADELDNVCAYVTRLPRDFCMLFMKDIIRIPDMNLRLMKSGSFQAWLMKNKNYI